MAAWCGRSSDERGNHQTTPALCLASRRVGPTRSIPTTWPPRRSPGRSGMPPRRCSRLWWPGRQARRLLAVVPGNCESTSSPARATGDKKIETVPLKFKALYQQHNLARSIPKGDYCGLSLSTGLDIQPASLIFIVLPCGRSEINVTLTLANSLMMLLTILVELIQEGVVASRDAVDLQPIDSLLSPRRFGNPLRTLRPSPRARAYRRRDAVRNLIINSKNNTCSRAKFFQYLGIHRTYGIVKNVTILWYTYLDFGN